MAPPPAVPPLIDAARVQTYNLLVPTATIDLTFPVFGADEDLQVYNNGARIGAWSFSSLSGDYRTMALPITDGRLTFEPPVTGEVQIVYSKRSRRLAQPDAPGIARREYNQDITDIAATLREHDYRIDQVLPPVSNSARADKLLGFDDAGAPVLVQLGSQAFDTIGLSLSSRFAITQTVVLPLINYIHTAGYLTPGDGGGALYKKVNAQPSHPASVQSANGIWFEQVFEGIIRPRTLGATAAGIDDSTAINNAVVWANYVSGLVGTRSVIVDGEGLTYVANSPLVKTAAGLIFQNFDLTITDDANFHECNGIITWTAGAGCFFRDIHINCGGLLGLHATGVYITQPGFARMERVNVNRWAGPNRDGMAFPGGSLIIIDCTSNQWIRTDPGVFAFDGSLSTGHGFAVRLRNTMDATPVSGTFIPGEALTASVTGLLGRLISFDAGLLKIDTTNLLVRSQFGPAQETVTGAVSGATCTINVNAPGSFYSANAGGELFVGCQANFSRAPLYVARGAVNVNWIGGVLLNGAVGGTLINPLTGQPGAMGAEIYGLNVSLVDVQLNSCAIYCIADASGAYVDTKIAGLHMNATYLNGNASAIVVMTDQPNTDLSKFRLTGPQRCAGMIKPLNLRTTGSGSFNGITTAQITKVNATGADLSFSVTDGFAMAGRLDLLGYALVHSAMEPNKLSASRALTEADCGQVLYQDNGATIVLTVPTTLFEGFHCRLVTRPTGSLTVTAAAGAFLNGTSGGSQLMPPNKNKNFNVIINPSGTIANAVVDF